MMYVYGMNLVTNRVAFFVADAESNNANLVLQGVDVSSRWKDIERECPPGHIFRLQRNKIPLKSWAGAKYFRRDGVHLVPISDDELEKISVMLGIDVKSG